jgi:hypothetical protein
LAFKSLETESRKGRYSFQACEQRH